MNIRRLLPAIYAIIIDALGFGLVYPVMMAIFASHASPVLAAGAPQALRDFYLGFDFPWRSLFVIISARVDDDKKSEPCDLIIFFRRYLPLQ